MIQTVMAELQPLAQPNLGTLNLRVSDFPALQEELGSVRLSVNPIGNDAFPQGDFYPIIINRSFANQFYALSAECTHASCVVPSLDRDLEAMLCPCHGSMYAIDGSVRREPATRPLRRFDLIYDGVDALTIKIPGLGYTVTGTMVRAGQPNRLRLTFATFLNAEYEIRYWPDLQVITAGTVVPFSFTESEAASTMVLIGDGSEASIFVDRVQASGFYSAAIRILDLT